MASITGAGGTTTSLSNTPQAGDDTYRLTEDALNGNGSTYDACYNTLKLDVMANDLGGKAKSLFSISDEYGNALDPATTDLLTSNVNTGWEVTEDGNWIRINCGKIEFKLKDPFSTGTPNTDPYYGGSYNALSASQDVNDHFTYAIRLGNGTLSYATVHIYIDALNDAIMLGTGGDVIGEVTETSGTPATDAAYLNDSGSFTYTDADTADIATVATALKSVNNGTDAASLAKALGGLTASITGDTASTNGGTVTWTYSVAPDHVESMAKGETLTLVYTVTVSDGAGSTVSRDVTVTITGTNDAPIVAAEDVTGAVTELVAPLDNLTDTGTIAFTDVDLLDVHSVGTVTASAGALGTLTASVTTDTTGSGLGGVVTWIYSVAASAVEYLAAGESKLEAFTFSVSDGQGGSVPRTVNVTITGTNDTPVVSIQAGDSAAETLFETDIGLAKSGTLTVVDPDTSDKVTASVDSVLATGDSGVLTYAQLKAMFSVTGDQIEADSGDAGNLGWTFDSGTQAFDFLAKDENLTLTYTVKVVDGLGYASYEDVEITITGTNDAPVAGNDAYSTDEDTALIVAANGMLGNDTDAEGNLLTAVLETGPAHGSLTLNTDGSFTYTPDANYNGTDSFTYRASDGAANSNIATVSLTVTPVNDAPTGTATHLFPNGTEDTSYTVTTAQLLAGFSDIDGGPLQVLNLTADLGTIEDLGGGEYKITPPLNYNEWIGLSYTVSDGNGGTVPGSVTLNFNPIEDVTIGDDSFTLDENQPLSDTVAGNDSTTSGGVLGYTVETGPAHGSLVLNSDGSFTYTPDANYAGSDSFVYRATDSGTLDSGYFGTVSLTIEDSNAPATITGPSTGSVTEDTTPAPITATGDLFSDDTDGPDDQWNAASGTTAHGSWTVSAAGVWVFTLNNAHLDVQALTTGQTLIDSFTVTTTDGTSQLVSVTIKGVPELGAVETGSDENDNDNANGTLYTTVTGSGLNGSNTLVGTAGNDGDGSGNDDGIHGGNDIDTLYGLAGNDFLYGDSGTDWIYGGSGNDRIEGGADTDHLYGGSGTDTIFGNALNDNIYGGLGADSLTGNSGADVFWFTKATDRGDTITDFNTIVANGALDWLNVSGIDANSANGSATNETFAWGGTAAQAHGLWYGQVGGVTRVYGDTDGITTTAEFWFDLSGNIDLNAAQLAGNIVL
jgi:VCBS repeat-containing protein